MSSGAAPPAGRTPTTGHELAALILAAPRWPMVTAVAMGGQLRVAAALLAWGRVLPPVGHGRSQDLAEVSTPSASQRGWMAGVAFLEPGLRGAAGHGLVTTWLRADQVRPHPHEDYRQVPRVFLAAAPRDWPALPACYPHATAEWQATHRHVTGD